jgi:hypothetical protein
LDANPFRQKEKYMKSVLFIAYYFPPMGSSGVQRSVKFVKYLQYFQLNPIVLTVDSRLTRWPKDKTFLSDVPGDVKVYRAPTFDMNWVFKILWGFRLNSVVNWLLLNLFIPDAEITWIPFAKIYIDRIIKTHKIDIVYITGGPFSSLLLGPYVRNKHGLKYIVYFRDEWTNNHSRLDRHYPKQSQLKDESCEREVVSNADGLVYAHPLSMKESFENKYPFLKDKKFEIITNGYDEADFTSQEKESNEISGKLRIVYPGSFYDRRRPTIIWKAIKELVESGEYSSDNIEVNIHGKNSPKFVMGEYTDDIVLKKIIRFYPYCSHQESLKLLLGADVLLLFLAPGPNSESELPGKMFEYLRSYKPIFAILPAKGGAADIILKSKSGWVYDSSDYSQVLSGVRNLISRWVNKDLIINPDKDYIKQYERKHLTGLLAKLINEVAP